MKCTCIACLFISQRMTKPKFYVIGKCLMEEVALQAQIFLFFSCLFSCLFSFFLLMQRYNVSAAVSFVTRVIHCTERELEEDNGDPLKQRNQYLPTCVTEDSSLFVQRPLCRLSVCFLELTTGKTGNIHQCVVKVLHPFPIIHIHIAMSINVGNNAIKCKYLQNYRIPVYLKQGCTKKTGGTRSPFKILRPFEDVRICINSFIFIQCNEANETYVIHSFI